MNTNTKPAVTTLNLNKDDLNLQLADLILEDCRRANEPSAYITNTLAIFVRAELMTGEPCVVVPLPGIASGDVPSTDESPSLIVLRERRNGKGDAYLQLRGGNVSLRSDTFQVDDANRQLVLYIFDDCASLDLIAITERLIEDIGVHAVCAQSRHFFDNRPFEETTKSTFDVPLVARRTITVTSRQTANMPNPESD